MEQVFVCACLRVLCCAVAAMIAIMIAHTQRREVREHHAAHRFNRPFLTLAHQGLHIALDRRVQIADGANEDPFYVVVPCDVALHRACCG